jgi:hypothetical protein
MIGHHVGRIRAGLVYQITPSWQVFIEGDYYQLADKSLTTRCRVMLNSQQAPYGSARLFRRSMGHGSWAGNRRGELSSRVTRS